MDYWLQISITVEQPAVQRITEAMDGLGAVAVSRQHAGGSARFDTALSNFQGWSTENVSGLFPQTPAKRLSVITFMTPVADTPGSIVKS